MSKQSVPFAGALILLAATINPASVGTAGAHASRATHRTLGPCNHGKPPGFQLQSTIAFSSTREDPTATPAASAARIYLMSPDGTNLRRLPDNFADGFPNLSPDGKRIVFDGDRLSGRTNDSDLFLMNADGTEQTVLTHGSSASWSPDCKDIAFHASASGTGTPIRTDPGSATTDSDIFVANIDNLLARTEQPTNVTNSPDQIEDDADWSAPSLAAPHGRIVFTAHAAHESLPNTQTLSNDAEIYVINPDGTGRTELTVNDNEERAPAWSPDGTRIAYSCRVGGGNKTFQICVMNADGSDQQQLTDNTAQDLTPSWSPDGQQIVFHRQGLLAGQGFQLFTMDSNRKSDGTLPDETQLTFPPGINLIAHWGVLRVKA